MSTQLRLTIYGVLATMATATALISVYSTSAWVIPVMGAIIIVGGSCALIRSSPLPSALEPIAAAVAVLCWVTALYARSEAHLGFIPGRLALRSLDRTARRGFSDIHQLPTPAPAHHGLVLLTVVGVAAIALVVDLLTVTLRRGALAGLPLLALFTVCAATGHHGVGLLPFILASIGYLWLLFADNREKVARWGAAVGTGSRARPASAWSTDESSAPRPASLGRRVATAAIGLGVVVPLFIPGLHTGIDKHGTGGGGSGGGDKIVLNPIVSVASDLTSTNVVPVIRYRTSAADPGYLRLTSLDMFNGSTFSASKLQAPPSSSASENLPVTPPAGPIINATITISPALSIHWLPVAATALGVSVGDNWRYDPGTATIFSATTTTAGLRYTTQSVSNDPTPAELSVARPPGKALDADLTLPDSISPAIKKLTQSITANARSPYDAALDIQDYFTTGGRFSYDTSIKADNSPDALADFVLHTRRGFCQQFATAMAVMARLSGIPSRVAVGFTRGTKQTDGSWLVTTHDAHAWPELYFQGYGWLPFEPTPRADGQAVIPPYATQQASSRPGGKQTPQNTQSSSPSGHASRLRTLPPGAGSRNKGDAGTSTVTRPAKTLGVRDGTAMLVLILLVLILAVPAAIRVVTRQRRWRHLRDPTRADGAAWAELRDSAIDLRVPWDDGHTPRQICASTLVWLRADDPAQAAMQRLARYEERSRYSPTPTTPEDDPRRDVLLLRKAAAVRRSGAQRAMAWAMPRSTLQTMAAAVGHLGDRFDQYVARLTRGLRTRIASVRP